MDLPILGIINRSKTLECGNWDRGRAIPRKGIHIWHLRCSVGINRLSDEVIVYTSLTNTKIVAVRATLVGFLFRKEVWLCETILVKMKCKFSKSDKNWANKSKKQRYPFISGRILTIHPPFKRELSHGFEFIFKLENRYGFVRKVSSNWRANLRNRTKIDRNRSQLWCLSSWSGRISILNRNSKLWDNSRKNVYANC